MNKPNDTDLREALRRQYADTPQLPDDFMERMHQAVEKSDKRRTIRRWLYPISIGTVAASLLLILMLNHGNETTEEHPLVAQQTTEVTQQNATDDKPQPTADDQLTASGTTVQNEAVKNMAKAEVNKPSPAKKARKRRKEANPVQQTPQQNTAIAESESQETTPATSEPANPIHYAEPDPYLMMASQAQDIRTRGERLQKEVASLMNDL